MEKVIIDKDVPLNPGDIIEMHYITAGMGIITATQIALIEWRLEARKDFDILSYRLPPGSNRVIFTIQIKEPVTDDIQVASVAVTAAIIGAAIIGAGVIGLMTLDKILLIMESPAAKVGVVGFGGLAAAAAIVLVVGLLGGSK
ncbi:unnamed protein product [marine sediment metagenome]|uniref:Uncharacterized protein n=1 Tax=marine sediment metagenome TaxID=412755 RepID=X1KW98_9ZZZZ